MTNNFRARTAQEQEALERQRATFTRAATCRGCLTCIKNRARCPVLRGGVLMAQYVICYKCKAVTISHAPCPECGHLAGED